MQEIREHAWGDPSAEISLAEMTIRAGCTSPRHRHGNCEEQVLVHGGNVILVVDGEPRDLRTGDSARVPRGAPHHVIAAPDRAATLVLVWWTPHREYEEL